MFIIIEGMDKTGKSTLCNYLLKHIPDAYLIKNGSKPKNGSVEERQKIANVYDNILRIYNIVFKGEANLIVDRFLFSEYVYSQKRGYDAFKDEDLNMIKEDLQKMGEDVVLIYCSTDIKNIQQKFIDDGEDHTKIEEIEPLMKRYREAIDSITGVYKLPYDYAKTSPEQVARQIRMLITDKEE